MNRYDANAEKPEGWYWVWWMKGWTGPIILQWVVTKEGNCWCDCYQREYEVYFKPDWATGPIEMPKEIEDVKGK